MNLSEYRTVDFIKTIPSTPLFKWFFSGGILAALNILLLYILQDRMGLDTTLAIGGFKILVSTLIAAETGIIIRFFVNERWVFKAKGPFLLRFTQFHAATAAGTSIWILATNALHNYGIDHLIAAVLAMAFSTGFNLTTNFFWVWRKNKRL